MKKYLLGFLGGIVVVILSGYLFIRSGMMPVTTSDAPAPFEKFLARTAIRAAIRKEAGLKPSFVITEEHLKTAAKNYMNHCAGCHGLIETETAKAPKIKIADTMFPPAPQLFDKEEMVTDDSIGQIRWKLVNGIRLTGMPAFKNILNEQEIWALAGLLQQADKISPSITAELQYRNAK